MACSKEEIERKRLAAIQKRQSKLNIQNNLSASPAKPINQPIQGTSYGHSNPGPLKSFNNYNNKTFHPYSKPETGQCSNSLVNKVVSGTIYLISEDRFEVNPSEFCVPLINIFKSIPSKNYDPKSKLWNFSVDDYELLISKVAPLAPHVVLGTLPPYVLKVLREPTVDPNNVDLSPVEATLRNKLMPFQAEGVRFAIARRGRCMIADDMGLGKTFQALAVASYYRQDWPLLVVTTSSMRETWQNKIHELLPSVPLMNIVTLSSGRDSQLVADKQTEVVIVSYKITVMHTELLKNKKFGVVILDESHHLKSSKAQCTISVRAVTSKAKRAILLSGTPALSRPVELYSQISVLKPPLFPSYTEYGKRYCAGKQTAFGWDMSGQSLLTELQVLLTKSLLIRRTKEQVLTNLEAKTRESVILDHSLLEFTKEDKEGLSQMAQNYKQTRSNDRHAALVTFFSESARVKIPAICKYIRQLLKENTTEKILIFAHHKNMIEAICLTLDEVGVHYICIVGSTPAHTRADLVDKFQHVATCRVGVLSITAANSGLTLTAASLVLFAELHWNPGILTQAEARAHRIGQTGGVCVRYLLANGTCDDYMWPMLQEKLNVLNDVGLSKDTFEDTTTKHQESKNNITQYLSPSCSKNKNDYIPGTNIRKSEHKVNSEYKVNSERQVNSEEKMNSEHSDVTNGRVSVSEQNGELDDIDKTFFDDDEGDDFLANLEL